IDGNGGFYFFNGLGGTVSITNGGAADYRTRVTCTVSGGFPVISYTTGAQDVFGWGFHGTDGFDRYFLQYRIDPQGNTNSFNWATNANNTAYLVSITDVDTNTTSFTYTNDPNGYLLLWKVTDAASHTIILNQDLTGLIGPNSAPALTNIVD